MVTLRFSWRVCQNSLCLSWGHLQLHLEPTRVIQDNFPISGSLMQSYLQRLCFRVRQYLHVPGISSVCLWRPFSACHRCSDIWMECPVVSMMWVWTAGEVVRAHTRWKPWEWIWSPVGEGSRMGHGCSALERDTEWRMLGWTKLNRGESRCGKGTRRVQCHGSQKFKKACPYVCVF